MYGFFGAALSGFFLFCEVCFEFEGMLVAFEDFDCALYVFSSAFVVLRAWAFSCAEAVARLAFVVYSVANVATALTLLVFIACVYADLVGFGGSVFAVFVGGVSGFAALSFFLAVSLDAVLGSVRSFVSAFGTELSLAVVVIERYVASVPFVMCVMAQFWVVVGTFCMSDNFFYFVYAVVVGVAFTLCPCSFCRTSFFSCSCVVSALTVPAAVTFLCDLFFMVSCVSSFFFFSFAFSSSGLYCSLCLLTLWRFGLIVPSLFGFSVFWCFCCVIACCSGVVL